MLKRSFVFAGVAGVSLLAAAAEPAPNAQNAGAPTVTEEETITIVAVPGSAAAGKCAEHESAKCAPGAKCAAPKKQCDPKMKCAVPKECDAKTGCAAAAVPEYSESDYELAYTLMEAGGVPAGIDDSNNFIILEQMEQMPMLKPAQPAFEKFFDDYCSYQALKRDLARIHLETFTRDEMRKIIDFFNSPEGKKLAASHAGLNHRTLELRADRINRNLPKLQKGVHECLVQAQQSEAAPATAAAK